MSEQQLRKELIRLAYNNPHLRPDVFEALGKSKSAAFPASWLEKPDAWVAVRSKSDAQRLAKALKKKHGGTYLIIEDKSPGGSWNVVEESKWKKFRGAKYDLRVHGKVAAEIKTPKKETFYGIMGREKGKGRFKPFDYQAGRFVTNVIYQTMWGDKQHVQKLVDAMNKQNPGYEFKVVKRGSKTAAYNQNLDLRQMQRIQRRHSLPGEISGRGKEWELEVPDAKARQQWEKVLGYAMGGYRTGYGGWVLRPNYQGKGDWNDPSSRHHYGQRKESGKVQDFQRASHHALPIYRALKNVLPQAFAAGQAQSSEEEARSAGREAARQWKVVKATMEKLAPSNWGGPLGGIPQGTISKLSESLFEYAFLLGRAQGPQKRASLSERRAARVASMFTADMDLSYAEQFRLMRSNPPKMRKTQEGYAVDIYSPHIKKYMTVAEWSEEKSGKADLVAWQKAHKETLQKLKAAVAKEKRKKASGKTARVPSALRYITQGRGAQLVQEGKNIRVYKGDNSIFFIEIPQKPLKRRKVRVMSLFMTQPRGLPGFNAFLPVNLLSSKPYGARLGKSDTYDQAVKKLRTALGKAEDAVVETWKANPPTQAKKPDPWFPSIQEDEVNYLLIEPSDTKPQTIKGKDFTVRSTWINFEAYSPQSDFQQSDPHYIKYEAKSPAAARKLYKILKANPDALKQVPWSRFDDWLNKNKVKYDTHFSQWT